MTWQDHYRPHPDDLKKKNSVKFKINKKEVKDQSFTTIYIIRTPIMCFCEFFIEEKLHILNRNCGWTVLIKKRLR